MGIRFTKMHGIGNDYVYVNGYERPLANPEALAPRIADRHTGVGGDGLVVIAPPETGVPADVRMRMFNADGSEGQMCGNAIRCVVKYAHDHGLSAARPMRVQTGRGVLSVEYQTNGERRVHAATVDMDEPILEPDRIPVRLPGLPQVVNHPTRSLFDFRHVASLTDQWVGDCGLDARMTCVSMGNPHVVIYCRDVWKVPLEAVGPVVERHPVFPERINVHFAQVDARGKVTMRTWERGSGVTLACGTGACAVCVAGVLTDRTDRELRVRLPGGELDIAWRTKDNHVFMTGPAEEVFTGEWPEG